MKKLIAIMVALAFTPAVWAAGVNWSTNFAQAQAEAKSQDKPMVVLFTGSDWCAWCMKLEKEVFDKPAFAQMAGSKYIFVKLDFPMRAKQSATEKKQNEQLKDRYGVSGFPTVIVLSPSGEKIGETGYQKGGPKAYAEHLQSMLSSAERFDSQVEGLASAELEVLYRDAVDLGRVAVAQKAMAKGLEVSSGSFFLAEKYRQLVVEHGADSFQAQAVRRELLSRDPENAEGRHLFVAVLDFQEHIQKEMATQEAMQPLVDYLDGIGQSDEGRWRVELTLAQFLDSRGEELLARQWAEQSYVSAPEESRRLVRTLLE